MATTVCCGTCGLEFEEEGALEMGASVLEREGKRVWFCCPHCEGEHRARRS